MSRDSFVELLVVHAFQLVNACGMDEMPHCSRFDAVETCYYIRPDAGAGMAHQERVGVDGELAHIFGVWVVCRSVNTAKMASEAAHMASPAVRL